MYRKIALTVLKHEVARNNPKLTREQRLRANRESKRAYANYYKALCAA